jgi:hypothetical protein
VTKLPDLPTMSMNAWTRVNAAFKSVPGSADAMLGLDKADLK